jgi:hypothetical protein
MSKRANVVLIVAWSVGASVGCGSSGPSAEQACSDLAQARCMKRQSCTNGAGITRAYGDMATCVARESLSCTIALAAPSTGNSPAAVEACVAAFATYACVDFLDDNPPAACIATGPGVAGAACTFAGQCASTYCAQNKTAVCGTCGDPPLAGASCATSVCARAQECVSASITCAAYGQMGAACDSSHPCAADLSCVGAATMGTCSTSLTTAGAACGGTTMMGCDTTQGLACLGAVGKKSCAAITYVAGGMPCGLVSMDSFVGCLNGSCYTATGIATGTEQGTCKTTAADGAACDTVLGPGCLSPARCITSGGTAGTCTVPDGHKCG